MEYVETIIEFAISISLLVWAALLLEPIWFFFILLTIVMISSTISLHRRKD